MKIEYGVIISILLLVFGSSVLCASALLPTADNFGVEDTNGYYDSNVTVPVSITNTQNGLINSIIFNIEYDKSIITLNAVEKGDLTTSWDTPSYNDDFSWGTRVSIVYDGVNYIPIGSSGSVVILDFTVHGSPGSNSVMNLNDIQLSDENYQVGTAAPKNGIFSVIEHATIYGNTTNVIGNTTENVIINVYTPDLTLYQTTITNETGYYSLDVDVGVYYITFLKDKYYGTSTITIVNSGEVKNVDATLLMKGDLNNNGIAADAGDLGLMKDASVGKIGL